MNLLFKSDKNYKGMFYVYIIVVILMIIFYNHIRIFEFYDFNIFEKNYTLNFVPFKDMYSIILDNGFKLVGKILYFTALYFLVFLALINSGKRLNFVNCVICMVLPWIGAEILYIVTSTQYINIDINQGIVLLIGFGLALLIYKKLGSLQHA